MARLLSEQIGAHIEQMISLRDELDPAKEVDRRHFDAMITVWERWQLHALNMESKLARIQTVLPPAQPEIPLGSNVVRLPVRRKPERVSWPA